MKHDKLNVIKSLTWNINGSIHKRKDDAKLMLKAHFPHFMVLIEPRKKIQIDHFNTFSAMPISNNYYINVLVRDNIQFEVFSDEDEHHFMALKLKIFGNWLNLIVVY
jgi:hypothetical protein